MEKSNSINSIYKENSLKNSKLSNIIEESHSFNNTSNIYNLITNNRNTNNISQKYFYRNNGIKKKVMVSLLKAMNRNTHMCLNNINSLNFIYQAYGKGMNIINNDKNLNLNKTQNIMNCLQNNKFNTSFSFNNESNKISIFKNTHNFFSTKKPNEPKFILKSNNSKKYIKRSNSCYTKKKNKNQKENFILLPIKNILIKKTIENYQIPNIVKHKDKERTSIIFRKKELVEEEKQKEFIENLKIFSEKYEKEKEDFNNILFDEFIEIKKKKFKLESFIKKFSNNHFVEKLYKIKEFALQKNQSFLNKD